MAEKLLEVKELEVSFKTYAGIVKAVRGVSFYVNKAGSGRRIRLWKDSDCKINYWYFSKASDDD